MEEQLNNDVIRKIQLLLNLGQRSAGNETEASAAMDKAMELMTKYNLDMAVITTAAATEKKVVEKREEAKLDRSAMYEWQRKLCKAIAEANFCWYWDTNHRERHTYLERQRANQRGYEEEIWRYVRRHVILGRESNVIAVRIMYDYLVEAMAQLSPYKAGEHMSKASNSWKEGCAARLVQRIERKAYEMNHPRETAEADTRKMGLVLVDYGEKEFAANYDARFGEGAHEKMLERNRRWAEVEKNRTPATVDPEPVKELTKKEKEKAKATEERWWQSYHRKQQREYDKRDHDAYAAGAKAGESISLQDRINQK